MLALTIVLWRPRPRPPVNRSPSSRERAARGIIEVAVLDDDGGSSVDERPGDPVERPHRGRRPGALLVDAAWTDAQTEALLDSGQARFKRPWLRRRTITHDHADRDGGLGALRQRHIPAAALDLTVAKLAARGVHDVSVLFTAKRGVFADPRGSRRSTRGGAHQRQHRPRVPDVLFGGCLSESTEAKDLGDTANANLAAWPASVRSMAARYPE